ncbi:MAG: DUF1634 domain-containing protein [Thermoplasmata archaeon]
MTTNPTGPPVLPDSAYSRMAIVLRGGLLLALGIMVAALVWYLLVFPSATLAGAIATNPILGYLGLTGLLQGLASGAPAAYLTLGLLALVATPILRVASGFYYFRLGRERAMEAITLSVLVMLFFGLLVLGPLIR